MSRRRLDETDFLARLLPRLAMGPEVVVPPGDDCAAVRWREGRLLLLAVDQVAAGVHYYGRGARQVPPTPPAAAGRKLVARNVSDLAAMGGCPLYALLALAAPRGCPPAWLEAFADGVAEAVAEFGMAMIGGDLCRAGADVASLTVVGEVTEERVMCRHQGRAGELVLATGAFGLSLASGRHLSFPPRLAEGQFLAQHCRSAIDVSDGLLQDLARLATASGVQARLDASALPRTAWQGRIATLAEALGDGEDYELLATLPAGRWPAVRAAWPFATPLTVIGELQPLPAPDAPRVIDAQGTDLVAAWRGGFAHFG